MFTLPRPPTSPPFPYTTLFRSDGRDPYGGESLLEYHRHQAEEHRRRRGWYEGYELDAEQCAALRQESLRSEEHTSELQSPCNLVCRLLLEKKNKLHGRELGHFR